MIYLIGGLAGVTLALGFLVISLSRRVRDLGECLQGLVACDSQQILLNGHIGDLIGDMDDVLTNMAYDISTLEEEVYALNEQLNMVFDWLDDNSEEVD